MFFARPIGIFALLDEESNFPKATDTSLGAIYIIYLLIDRVSAIAAVLGGELRRVECRDKHR